MKSLLLSVVFGMTIAGGAMAQSGNTYDDDIYSSGPSTRKQRSSNENREPSRADNYDRPGDDGFTDNGQTSYSGDSYIDYDDDDYYYSSSINRFGYSSFYNRPYFSTFANPYWYNPYWVDPYWGWSPWNRPGLSIGVSFGSPYWNSYWGWQNWYGYSPFNSFYYPSYYGGWGYNNWGCGGYYGNYWNGYYAGIYNGYGNGWNYRNNRNITYGPRYSMNNIANNRIGRGYPGAVGSGRMAPGGLMRSTNGNLNNGNAARDFDRQPRRGGFFNSGERSREYNPNYNSNVERPAPSGNAYRERPVFNENSARPAPGAQMDGGGFRGSDMNAGEMQRMRPSDRQMQVAPVERNDFRGREMNSDFQRPQQLERQMQAAPMDRGSRMEMRQSAPSFNNAPSRGFGGGGGGSRMGGGGSRMGGFGGRR